MVERHCVLQLLKKSFSNPFFYICKIDFGGIRRRLQGKVCAADDVGGTVARRTCR